MGKRLATYIRVLPDRLDDVLVKVARVTHEGSSNVVCVLHALKDGVDDGHLGALSQLHLAGLHRRVQILDPAMVFGSERLVDVILEDDNVRVGDLLRVDRREERRVLAVDALVAKARLDVADGLGYRKQREQRKGCDALHDA